MKPEIKHELFILTLKVIFALGNFVITILGIMHIILLPVAFILLLLWLAIWLGIWRYIKNKQDKINPYGIEK